MDTFEAIFTRRSIRAFMPDPVSETDLEQLLKAGMQAPSARNEQPWHFIVIDAPDRLKAIPTFHTHAQMLNDAPLAILVCSDRKLESKRATWLQDCSAATENILLAAHALGLGAVWLGIFPDSDRVFGMQTLLDMPKDIRPVALVAIGHPAEEVAPENRYDPSRIHRNQW